MRMMFIVKREPIARLSSLKLQILVHVGAFVIGRAPVELASVNAMRATHLDDQGGLSPNLE